MKKLLLAAVAALSVLSASAAYTADLRNPVDCLGVQFVEAEPQPGEDELAVKAIGTAGQLAEKNQNRRTADIRVL
jgi:opacity protein-like surface antigen